MLNKFFFNLCLPVWKKLEISKTIFATIQLFKHIVDFHLTIHTFLIIIKKKNGNYIENSEWWMENKVIWRKIFEKFWIIHFNVHQILSRMLVIWWCWSHVVAHTSKSYLRFITECFRYDLLVCAATWLQHNHITTIRLRIWCALKFFIQSFFENFSPNYFGYNPPMDSFITILNAHANKDNTITSKSTQFQKDLK